MVDVGYWCHRRPVFCSPLQDSLDALSCQQALGRHERCGDYDQPCPAWLDISTFSGDLMFSNHVKTLTNITKSLQLFVNLVLPEFEMPWLPWHPAPPCHSVPAILCQLLWRSRVRLDRGWFGGSLSLPVQMKTHESTSFPQNNSIEDLKASLETSERISFELKS